MASKGEQKGNNALDNASDEERAGERQVDESEWMIQTKWIHNHYEFDSIKICEMKIVHGSRQIYGLINKTEEKKQK